MKVNPKISRSWKILIEHGDIQKISESSVNEEYPNPISRITISHALRTGRMSERTFEVIQKFCKAKNEQAIKFIKEQAIVIDDNN